MIPAVEFRICTNNSTLRGNIDIYAPAKEDNRVFGREYKLHVENSPEYGYYISGSIKCQNKDDVVSICNNLIALAESNIGKIGMGSFIGIHYCNQVEEGKPVEPCTTEILWSKEWQ